MVIRLLILSLVCAYAGAEVRLVTECRRKQIYVGESVICDFEILATHSPVDVEVVKFPEFRGYWSDNLALRQGPIVLSWATGPTAERRGLVGTYIITPMLGRANPKIVPMKISAAGLEGIDGTIMMESEPADIRIRQLPKLPAGIPQEDFIGAVGEFALTAESHEILFHPDEPASIRFQIQGEGNFAELNEIPYVLPKGIEVLSKRSYQSGGRGLSSKVFDFRVLVRGNQNITIPARPIYYFNPVLGKYEPMNIPEIVLKYSSKVRVAEDEVRPIEIRPPYRKYSVLQSLFEAPSFWFSQCLLIVIAAGVILYQERKRWLGRRRQTREFILKRRLRELKKLETANDQAGVLRAANELLDSHLFNLANAQLGDSVALVLRKHRDSWKKDWVDRFEQVYYQIQQFEYARPDERTPVAWAEMRQNFLEILKQNPMS